MRIAVCLLALLPVTAATAADETGPASTQSEIGRCADNQITKVVREHGPLRAHALDHEPLAKQEIAVQHSVGGCIKPVIVRQEVGKDQR